MRLLEARPDLEAAASIERPLVEALEIARRLSLDLAPACERLVVAGSVRRQRRFVRDLELVAIPATRTEPGPQAGLFDAVETEPVNALWQRIEDMGRDRIEPIKVGVPGIEPDERWADKRRPGSKWFKLWLPEDRMKVDLFMATPATWGAILAIRTGSAEFARALVTRWTMVSNGGHFKDGELRHRNGAVVATPEEPHVFAACRAVCIAPALRNTAKDLRRD